MELGPVARAAARDERAHVNLWIAVLLMAAVVAFALPTFGQTASTQTVTAQAAPTQTPPALTPPSRLQGPVTIAERSEQLDREALAKERFRRKAAEEAQKQLEQLADQMRDQLGKEIAARKAAERTLAERAAQTALADQIDQERQRLRDDREKELEARRKLLEREVADLTSRLRDETNRRKQLEARQAGQHAVPVSRTGGTNDDLAKRVKELEKKLAAAEWARRLAEAQLRLVNQRRTERP